MHSFLKDFRIQLFSKVLYIGHVAMFYSTCDIYDMLCAVLIQYFTHKIYLDFM